MNVLGKKDFGTHVAVVGWLQIANGLLGLLLGALAATLLVGLAGITDIGRVLQTTTLRAAVIGGLMVILSIPGIVAGIGLLRRASWSRVMALVLSAFELVLFPFGTLLAAYTVFVLSQQAAVEAFGVCCSIEDSRPQAAAV
jgi:ABC-type Fe3+ transport system permease subunit